MANRKSVGKAIATAYPKSDKSIPDYEFPDSGHVKLRMTNSDVAMLDASPSEPEISSINQLITSPSICKLSNHFILSCWARHVGPESGIQQILIGASALIVGIIARDWYRLHGEKLTRALRALLNVANMLKSFEIYSIDLFGIRRLKIGGKYVFTQEGPAINESIPRTPEMSPPKSPKSNKTSGKS